MARDLGASHREAHVGEEPALPALADDLLGVVVGLGRRGADDVDSDLPGQPLQLAGLHSGHRSSVRGLGSAA